MKTKNNSIFETKFILISRKDYDLVVKKEISFLQHLFATYRRAWSLAGVKFYNVDSKDFVKLFKLLA